ncbi:MAG: nicotinate-nucleotide adenylyltransferase, partial [Bacteroidota bacterium]
SRLAAPDHGPAALASRVLFLDTPVIELSSTCIRRRVQDGRTIRCMVPAPVEAYIAQQGLYTG